MTPLRPLPDDRSARGVSSERYPLNAVCAHPECKEPVVDPHHTFARKQIGNDSWFVSIQDPDEAGQPGTRNDPIPHVAGLCREHHDQVESHEAWIKLEESNFVWYDRWEYSDHGEPDWKVLGPLNPQPGSREGKPKRKKHRGEARRQRKTISVRVPDDAAEDGAGLLDEAIETLEAALGYDDARPVYYTIMDALNIALLDPEVSRAAKRAQGKQPSGGNE